MAKAVSVGASYVYDGTSTSDAKLQEKATGALLVASGAEVIPMSGDWNALELLPVCTTAAQGANLYVAEFERTQTAPAVPTVSQQRLARVIPVSAADNPVTVDRAVWGLTTATEHTVKKPIIVPVTKGNRVMISLAAMEGSTVWYLRYRPLKLNGIVPEPPSLHDKPGLPGKETPLAALTGSAADQYVTFASAAFGAYEVEITTTADDAYVNFVSPQGAPAQAGRRLLVNSTVRLDVPVWATDMNYKWVTGAPTLNVACKQR